MAFQRDGVMEFPVSGVARSFKYALSVSDELLQIWIEDTETREQWNTKPLAVSDFTTMHSTIPLAGAEVYAQHFSECLEPKTGSLKTTKWLSNTNSDNSRELCVGFELQVMAFSTSLEYTFTLEAVALSPMDLLTSRVKDLEAMVLELKQDNRLLQTEFDALASQLKTTWYQVVHEAIVSLIQRFCLWASTVDFAELLSEAKQSTVKFARRVYSGFPASSQLGAFVVRVLYAVAAVLSACLVGLKYVGSGMIWLLCGGERASVKPRAAKKLN